MRTDNNKKAQCLYSTCVGNAVLAIVTAPLQNIESFKVVIFINEGSLHIPCKNLHSAHDIIHVIKSTCKHFSIDPTTISSLSDLPTVTCQKSLMRFCKVITLAIPRGLKFVITTSIYKNVDELIKTMYEADIEKSGSAQ